MYNASKIDKEAPKILRPIYRDIRDMEPEEVLAIIEQDIQLGDVTRIEVKFGTEMSTEYFDDGRIRSLPDSMNEILSSVELVALPFPAPIFTWLSFCSEIIRTKGGTPKFIICRSIRYLLRLAGLPETLFSESQKLLNYSIIEFDGIRICDMFLVGVPSFRSPLNAATIIYHNTYPEREDEIRDRGITSE